MQAVVFDLDDTLICGDTGKVPKQTFHLLRKLQRAGIKMGIISANPMAVMFAQVHRLAKYIPFALSQGPKETRAHLFGRALDKLGVEPDNVLYCDDGARNLASVAEQFPRITTLLCEDVQQLHTLFEDIS